MLMCFALQNFYASKFNEAYRVAKGKFTIYSKQTEL